MKQSRTMIHGFILEYSAWASGCARRHQQSHRKDIAARALEDKLNSLSQVIPDSIHDNKLVENVIT